MDILTALVTSNLILILRVVIAQRQSRPLFSFRPILPLLGRPSTQAPSPRFPRNTGADYSLLSTAYSTLRTGRLSSYLSRTASHRERLRPSWLMGKHGWGWRSTRTTAHCLPRRIEQAIFTG